jgi:hypothetical protein
MAKGMTENRLQNMAVELSAVIVSVAENNPVVMVVRSRALPSGALGAQHRTLEQGLRAWVKSQSGMELGYVEQLYTFADKNRTSGGRRIVSIGYLALTREMAESSENSAAVNWYDFFPWEDHRKGWPESISTIRKSLEIWKNAALSANERKEKRERIEINFPVNPRAWNEELVLQRYELLWEAGLLSESECAANKGKLKVLGRSMDFDHRRILATGMARLRAKIKYRPVVFELMPDKFTLLQLQGAVEALAGLRLHKQNFRRLVQGQGLVEETGKMSVDSKGRPAKLFSFRRKVLRERAFAGTKLPRSG